MKHTNKAGRWLSILLILVMVLTLLPTAALAAPGDLTQPITITAQTSDAETNMYTWSQNSSTLTLKGLSMTVSAAKAITVPEDATIRLEDGTNNTIVLTGDATADALYGIFSAGDFYIEGTGSLTIMATVGTSGKSVYGLYSGGTLIIGDTINTPMIDLSVGATLVPESTIDSGATISAIKAETKVEIRSANVTAVAECQGMGAYGVEAGRLDVSKGPLLASGSTAALKVTNTPTIKEGLTVLGSAEGVYDSETVTGEVTWDGTSGNYKLTTPEAPALAVYIAEGGGEPDPGPTPSGPADYTLYYNKTDGKMYKEQAYTTEVTGLEGWSGSTTTLTLNNFNFTTTADTALVFPANCTIVLTGTSTITGKKVAVELKEDDGSNDWVTIKGQGTLNFNVTASEGDRGNYGMRGKNVGLIVDGATLISKGNEGSGTFTALYPSNLTLKNGANVTLEGLPEGSSKENAALGTSYPFVFEGTGNTLTLKSVGSPLLSEFLNSDGTTTVANLTASTNIDGSNPVTGIDSVRYDMYQSWYKIGDGWAHYLKFTGAPVPPAEYSLYFEGGKLYKRNAAGESQSEYTAADGNEGLWEASGTTLTLKDGFAFSTTMPVALEFAPNTAATLTVNGTASLKSTYESNTAVMGTHGIFASADLTINGGGALTAQGGKDTTESCGMSTGLYLFNSEGAPALTVDATTVNLTGGDVTSGNSAGLAVGGNLTMNNGANVTAASTQSVGDKTLGYGTMVTGTLTVSDTSKLTAKGGTYAWAATKINEDYTLTASTNFDGADANSEGVTSANMGDEEQPMWLYKKGGEFAKYLTVKAKTDDGGGDIPSGGGVSPTVTVPVSGKDSIKVSASISGSTANISAIDTSKLGAENSTITIDLSVLNQTINKVNLPVKSVDDIVNAGANGLKLKLTTGMVEFDAKALAAINDAADGSNISLEVKETSASSLSEEQKETISDMDNAVVVDINLVCDGKVITDFKGGQATVTIPYELKEGQDPESLTVYFLAADGTLTAMETTYDAETKTVTFIAPHFSSYIIAGESMPFVDVKRGDWYYKAVKLMYEKGLMNGTSANTFSPDDTTTRGMIVTIFYRLEGSPAVSGGSGFSDVAAGQYYSDAVAWASTNGVVTGYGDGRFCPDEQITREQLAAILYRYAQYKGHDMTVSGDLSVFKDQPDPWAAEFVKWAVGKGFINGKGSGVLDPKGFATRAEAAVLLQRFIEA